MGVELQDRELIHIICYCLIPNHYHLLVKQVVDRGIEKIIHKVGTGYTNYFNKKYNRSGALFQGKYKAKHIEDDLYLAQLSTYIHLNPISHRCTNDISNYPWSSYLDYVDLSNSNLCNKKIILNNFKNCQAYQKFVIERGLDIANDRKMQKIFLEK